MNTQHQRKPLHDENTTSSKTQHRRKQHRRKHSIVKNTASYTHPCSIEKSCLPLPIELLYICRKHDSKDQKHSIAENTASSKTQHCRKHSIVKNTTTPKTHHRTHPCTIEKSCLPLPI